MSRKSLDLGSVAVIGAGNLGSAISKALVGEVEVFVSGRRQKILEELKKEGCKVRSSFVASSKADAIFLTVKPKDVPSALEEIRDGVRGKRVVSFAAMVKLEEMRRMIPDSIVFRAMTNIFAEKGRAFTVYYPSKDEKLEKLLSFLGEVYNVRSESEVDIMTLFSGSSPAFVSKIIQGFIYAGLKCGLTYELAKKAAISIFEGTAIYLKDKEPEELIKRIATPAGTTIEGIKRLEKHRIEYAIIDAFEAGVEIAR
jgi:pyrroline-5-carboxylate reductase